MEYNVLSINCLPRSSKTGKGGTGTLTKWNQMFCLQAGQPHYVLVTPKSTPTQTQSINITLEEQMRGGALRTRNNNCKELEIRKDNVANSITSVQSDSIVVETSETVPKSTLKNFPTSTYLLEDSLAKLSALLESEGDLTTPEELSSMTSCGFSKKSSQDTSYWKTSKDCFLMTEEELLKSSSPRLLSWGMAWNGKYLTQRISESPRIGKECSLSDILEDSVDDKYFLSEQAVKRMIYKLKS